MISKGFLNVGGGLIGAASEKFLGDWDCTTNTPTITSGVGKTGEYYKVVKLTGGAIANIDGVGWFATGDHIVFDGTYWCRVAGDYIPTAENPIEELAYYNNQSAAITKEVIDLQLSGKSNIPLSKLPLSCNLSGAEWNSGSFRNQSVNLGVSGNLYFPTDSYIAYLASQKVTEIRFCFSWEGLQPILYDDINNDMCHTTYYPTPGSFHSTYLASMKRVIDTCALYKINVVLDNHSFGKYNNVVRDPLTTLGINIVSTSDGRYKYNAPKNREVVSYGSNGVITLNAAYAVGDPIKIDNTVGKYCPPELIKGDKYYAVESVGNAVKISNTPSGSPIVFTPKPQLTATVKRLSDNATLTLRSCDASGVFNELTWAVGTAFVFVSGDMPLPFVVGTTYYVLSDKKASLTSGGSVIIPASVWYQPTTSLATPAGVSTLNNGIYVPLSFANNTLKPEHLVDFWVRAVAEFDAYPNVIGYGLSNEAALSGNSVFTTTVVQKCIDGIRAAGSKKKIYIDGPYTNSDIAPYHTLNIVKHTDPAANLVYEVHTYFDASRSGNYFSFASETMQANAVESGRVQIRGVTQYEKDDSGISNVSSIQKAVSLKELGTIMGSPVYVGEYAAVGTSDDWITALAPFVTSMRKHGSTLSSWAASTNPSFLREMLVFPTVQNGKSLPNRTLVPIYWDSNTDFAKMGVFCGDNNSIIIEMVGNTTHLTKVTISGSASSIDGEYFIPAGINQRIEFDYPVVATKQVAAITTNRGDSFSLELYPAYIDGDSTPDNVLSKVVKNKGMLFKAGVGFSDFDGGVPTVRQTLFSNVLPTDERYFVKNLRPDSEASKIDLATDSVGKLSIIRTSSAKQKELIFLKFSGTKNWKRFDVTARDNGNDFFASNGYTYNNGVNNDGVGATLSNEANPLSWKQLTADGYPLKVGDIVAVCNWYQSAGFYIVTKAATDATTHSVLTRHPDYTNPAHFFNTYFLVKKGINNKNVVYRWVLGGGWDFTRNGFTTTTWSATGLTAQGRLSTGFDSPIATEYHNNFGNYVFGCVIERTGNLTFSVTNDTIAGLSNGTGSASQAGVSFVATAVDKISPRFFSGDTTAGGYGGMQSPFAKTIPLNTPTSLIITVVNGRTLNFYLNGVLVNTRTETYMRDYNYAWLDTLVMGGSIASYNRSYIPENLKLRNLILSPGLYTDTDVAGISTLLLNS